MSTLVVNADLHSIRDIAPWIATNVGASFCPEDAAALVPRMELGLQELAVNIVEHGYAGRAGTIEWHFAARERSVVIKVIDDAPAVDLGTTGHVENAHKCAVADGSRPRVRGYGLALIEQLTSEFVVHRNGQTNRWRVVFPLTSPLQQAP